MHIIEIPFGSTLYDQSIALRDEILRKPLGLEFTTEDLSKEFEQHHFVYLDDCFDVKGVLVLVPKESNMIKMRQVAVENGLQGKGIGTELVRFSEEFCIKKGYNQVYLHAREHAVEFYLKLGYEIIGEPFTEVNIPHRKMIKLF